MPKISMFNILPFSISTIKKGVPKFKESARLIVKADVPQPQEEDSMSIFNKDKPADAEVKPDPIE